MTKIVYVHEHDGQEWELDVRDGTSLMEAAVSHNVTGIVAECGGSCSCATCHIYLDHAWSAAVEEAMPEELELVECLENARPNSRLACQVLVSAALDGLTVRIPVADA